MGSCAPRLYFKCSHKACQAKKHVQVVLAVALKNSQILDVTQVLSTLL